MRRVIATAIIGVLAGVTGTLYVVGSDMPGSDRIGPAIVRDIVQVPKMTGPVAAGHRRERYENLHTIEQVLALPTDFAQTEALYLLAGRADSGTVQHLVHEANRISDDSNRNAALGILFSRLTELDPNSALALSRTAMFGNNRNIENQVWESWGKLDLDAALLAAGSQSNRSRRYRAAQALFEAFGYLGNATTDRIRHELDIPPSDSVRARYLYQLADRSVNDAIAYVTGLSSAVDQQQNTYWLAYHLSRSDPDRAASVAELIPNTRLREAFRRVVANALGAVRPEEVLEKMLGGPVTPAEQSQLYGAMQALARQDLDSAMRHFERAHSRQDRMVLGSAIAQELARNDPMRAVEWARTNDATGHSQLMQHVLIQIASSDPQLAFSEATRIQHASQRQQAVASIVMTIASTDAALAATLVESIGNLHERESAATNVAMHWAQSDPDAAVDWLLSNNRLNSQNVLRQTAMQLAHRDIDAAMRLLPKLDAGAAKGLRLQIAQQMAGERSAGEALGFIRRFEGTGDYDELQAAVAGGVAQYDIQAAKQLADQLPAGSGRDRAYVQVVRQHAMTDPAQAANWLTSISNVQQRQRAAGQLANLWQSRDPDAALRWADKLPRGGIRDSAVAGLVSGWRDPTPAQDRLIESIGDTETRFHAWSSRIGVAARRDPAGARRLLQTLDLADEKRRQLESMIDRYENRM